MNKEKIKNKNTLKYNFLFTFVACILNFLAYKFLPNSKEHFIEYSILLNSSLLYFYFNNLFSRMRKMIVGIKKENDTVNIPLRLLLFFLLLLGVLIANVYYIYEINPNAVELIFISNLFVKTITNNIAFIILLIFIFLITPAIIIPNYDNTKHKKANNILLFLLLFISIFLCFQIYINIKNINQEKNNDLEKLNKISYKYTDKYLKYEDITEVAKEKIKENKISVPFSFTTKEKIAFSYEEANDYCTSLNAKVSTLSEIYNISFNKFQMKGEEYYWTSDKAGRTPILFHYKDLNFSAIKTNKNTKAQVICTVNGEYDYLLHLKKQNLDLEKKQTKIKKEVKDIDKTILDNEKISQESDFISFDIMHVNQNFFKNQIAKGYDYDRKIKINPINEVKTIKGIKKLQTEDNIIRLCHFPFINLINFDIKQEQEVWEQNFCSPNFILLKLEDIQKTQYEKDAYCQSHGGKIPNISELQGIMKTTNIIDTSKKYWVNNKITINGTKKSLYLNNLNDKIINLNISTENEIANVICIKNTKDESNIIANFKSKFPNVSGLYYAKKKCPNCDYYEMPDMVLNQ